MDYKHLSHSTWECKYHVVFGSKYRTKRLYGELRQELVPLFHKLALQKGCKIEEGFMMPFREKSIENAFREEIMVILACVN